MDPFLRSEIRRLLDAGETKAEISRRLDLPAWQVGWEAARQAAPVDIELKVGDRVMCRGGRIGRVRRFLKSRTVVGDSTEEWLACTWHLVYFPTRREIAQRAALCREKHLSMRRREAV